MNYWAGLYKVNLQAQIVDGVKLLLSTACSILLATQHETALAPPRLLLTGVEDEVVEEDEDRQQT